MKIIESQFFSGIEMQTQRWKSDSAWMNSIMIILLMFVLIYGGRYLQSEIIDRVMISKGLLAILPTEIILENDEIIEMVLNKKLNDVLY